VRPVDAGAAQRLGQPVGFGDPARVAGVQVDAHVGGGAQGADRLGQQGVALGRTGDVEAAADRLGDGVGFQDHDGTVAGERPGERADPGAVRGGVRRPARGVAGGAVPPGDEVCGEHRHLAGRRRVGDQPGGSAAEVDVVGEPGRARLIGDSAYRGCFCLAARGA
jgi:hypothetical protein